jgi:hypothetical protein
MSRRSDELVGPALRLAAATLIVFGAGAGAAMAQDSPSANSIKAMGAAAAGAAAKDAKPAPNPKDAAAQATTAARSGGGRKPVMRCWQEGKLLFEGAGMTPAAIGQASIELRNGGGIALQVFDLKNGLCLLDYSD